VTVPEDRQNLTNIAEQAALVASRLIQRLNHTLILRTSEVIEARELATTINLMMDVSIKARGLLEDPTSATGMDKDTPGSV